jgi:hypothetical protein
MGLQYGSTIWEYNMGVQYGSTIWEYNPSVRRLVVKFKKVYDVVRREGMCIIINFAI